MHFESGFDLCAGGFGEQDGNDDDGDLPQSAYATSRGGGSHAEAVPPQLYSRRRARHSQDNRMLHNAPQFLFPSFAQLYTIRSELGHQVAHTRLTTSDTTLSSTGAAHWARHYRWCACNNAAIS